MLTYKWPLKFALFVNPVLAVALIVHDIQMVIMSSYGDEI